MKKISIIIPIYNAEQYLTDCLSSIIKQTYKNLEVILINDGSKDKSEIICKQYAQKDNRIKYIEKENGGVSSARNKGLEIATGDYIVFVDSDDKIDLNAMQELIDFQEEKTLIGLKISSNSCLDIYNVEELITSILKNKALGVSCGYLFEKKKIGKLRFDTNTYYMEDTLFLISYLEKVEKIRFVPNAKYIYNQNNQSVTKLVNFKKTEENIKNFIYSLDQISIILNANYDLKYNQLITNKKVKLIESELIKYNKWNSIKEFCNSSIIRNDLNKCNENELLLIYKIIKKMIMKKRILVCYFYIKLRRLIIHLKRR